MWVLNSYNIVYHFIGRKESIIMAQNPIVTITMKSGDVIKLAIDASRIHIFDKDTEKCLVH